MAGAASLVAEWELLYDRFYRRRTLYEPLLWADDHQLPAFESSKGTGSGASSSGSLNAPPVDLRKFWCAAAPGGGAIALVRDSSKLVEASRGGLPGAISVYSSSGKPIAAFPWPRGARTLIQIGFVAREVCGCFFFKVLGLPSERMDADSFFSPGSPDSVLCGG
jgi:Vps16, N-terminal region